MKRILTLAAGLVVAAVAAGAEDIAPDAIAGYAAIGTAVYDGLQVTTATRN